MVLLGRLHEVAGMEALNGTIDIVRSRPTCLMMVVS